LAQSRVLNVYVGYDRQEVVAYHALCQSILELSSRPVRFVPINLANLRGLFDREMVGVQSTEFSFSRFLTPYLSDYAGWSLFMDCDMLVRGDVAELFDLADERYAVMVAQHDYVPRDTVKFLDHVQTRYAKKNWSSVMLLNNARCRALTPDYVNTASGLQLHQFHWLESEDLIGALPLEWNWLVGEYDFNPDARNAHFTRGGPWFAAYADSDYADEWRAAAARAAQARGKL
jgi:lipopolysaccharide biosynthesis glycosyltransferase